MRHTTNHNLNQWEPEDRLTRADLNADNARIDTALGAAGLRVHTGTYTGDGTQAERSFILGERPKVLFLCGSFGNDGSSYIRAAMFNELFQYIVWDGGGSNSGLYYLVDFTDNGFTVCGSSSNTSTGFNRNGKVYYYLALC